MKRIFDIVVSFLVLVCFLPFGLLLSVWIVLESRGGVFYKQERIGLKGKPFQLYKFRSMRPMSDQLGKLTVGNRDPRITRCGYIIRKYKLDEFPQFLNVIKGEMSIVGPRPEVQDYVKHYNEEMMQLLNVRPGITDYASLEYFEENALLAQSKDPEKTYIEEIMPAKYKLNLVYLKRPTLAHDLLIMWKTFVRILR